MWLSERSKSRPNRGEAGMGTVTLAGSPAGVYLAGERRDLPVLGPGGFAWAPMAGEQVLVLQAGGDGETPCVAAVQAPGGTEPGTVRIYNGTGTASISMDLEGHLLIMGKVLINGLEPVLKAPEDEKEDDKEKPGGGESGGEESGGEESRGGDSGGSGSGTAEQ